MNPAAEPTTVRESATTLVLDGNRGGGASHGLSRSPPGDGKKRELLKFVRFSFTRVAHIGRLGEYVEIAARGGFYRYLHGWWGVRPIR